MHNLVFDTSLVKLLAIQPGVDIWHTRMEEHLPSSFLPLLSADEYTKAMKIRDTVKSGYAMISRGILRVLLGRYLGITPADVGIEYLSNGKPVLSPGVSNQVAFNVSHSQSVLAIAISQNNPVGIDVEMIDPLTNPGHAGSLVFSPEEKTLLEKSETPLNDFFKIWTVKESILKATGDGFSYPSCNFSVISSNNSSILSYLSAPVTSNRKCEIFPFSLYGDYSGALSVIYP